MIGIITIHTGYNEGAVLQSLALSRLLAALTGEAVEVLDHRYTSALKTTEGPADTPRKQAIADFRDSRLPLSPERFDSDHRAAWAYAAQRYSTVVVGSDEVWKVIYRKRVKGLFTVQDDPFAPPYPNVWWPDASAGPVRIAYAVTAGARTDWTLVPRRHRAAMAEAVSGFRAIGLRDARTRAFLASVAPEAAERSVRVPDPTLAFDLLDGETLDMRPRLEALGVDFSRPRVAFVAGESPAASDLAARLEARGAQTVALSRALSGTALDLSGAPFDPLEWAAAFGAFDLVVSDRMHGCIFTLRSGRPLVMLDERWPTFGFATKNGELAERFGLEGFYFPVMRPETTGAALEAAACRALAGDWPFAAVRERLAVERGIALDFLTGALAKETAAAGVHSHAAGSLSPRAH